MSGHSKWHNIRVKKSKVDAQKGKIFTKIAREISMAIKQAGRDPEVNYRLKLAILKAKGVNMPQENIKRTIEKAQGAGESALLEIIYEGYAPYGVAILIEAATDNRNRTAAELRNLFSKYGGNLGESGCFAWMFDKKGLITMGAKNVSEEKILNLALEIGAEDFKKVEDSYEITTAPLNFHKIKQTLEEKKIKIESAEVTMIAKNIASLDKNQAPAVLKLMEVLEDHDDVQAIYANFDIPSSILEELSIE
ncbi:MAG: YebC/PmpR family DNA-binding transcriptional regulator [Armatimonadetes bacterium]|nr:YebC/PmpR family DNA-binding transcriptional regulator [Armatimonadota bacterium]